MQPFIATLFSRQSLLLAPLLVALVGLLLAASFNADAATKRKPQKNWRQAAVTATAYTLSEDETKRGNVGLAAWGDQIEPDMRVIAVSRDLIPRGLDHRTKVKIEGLPGTYTVRDKMNRRWRNKIDILVDDKAQAYEWGKRKVRIRWLPGRS